MTSEHETRTHVVVSWLREDAHENAERVLLAALNEIDQTQQRRSWWPARRFSDMNTIAKVLVATAAVIAVGLVGLNMLPGNGSGTGGQPPSPSPSMSPSAGPSASLEAHAVVPFAGRDAFGMCPGVAPDPSICMEDPRDDPITFRFQAPASWSPFEGRGAWIDNNQPPGGAGIFFYRGNWLFGDPCRLDENEGPDIAVGPTVDDFVGALVDHPSLDVTTPIDVTLAGYPGKYLDLTVPDDIRECGVYMPIASHIFAQGPGHRWHMWVLDVDGVRVLVETNDYAATPAQRLAEEQAIVDSLEITR